MGGGLKPSYAIENILTSAVEGAGIQYTDSSAQYRPHKVYESKDCDVWFGRSGEVVVERPMADIIPYLSSYYSGGYKTVLAESIHKTVVEDSPIAPIAAVTWGLDPAPIYEDSLLAPAFEAICESDLYLDPSFDEDAQHRAMYDLYIGSGRETKWRTASALGRISEDLKDAKKERYDQFNEVAKENPSIAPNMADVQPAPPVPEAEENNIPVTYCECDYEPVYAPAAEPAPPVEPPAEEKSTKKVSNNKRNIEMIA